MFGAVGRPRAPRLHKHHLLPFSSGQAGSGQRHTAAAMVCSPFIRGRPR
jgi:hypothetical protein